MHQSKELRDADDVVSTEKPASQPYKSGGDAAPAPDSLLHQRNHSRKKIEGHITVGSHVGTSTCRNNITYHRMLSGANIARAVREAYLKVIQADKPMSLQKAILRQNIAYFDKLGAGEVTTRIATDTNLLQGWLSFGLIAEFRWHLREGRVNDPCNRHVFRCIYNRVHKAVEDYSRSHLHYSSTWYSNRHIKYNYSETRKTIPRSLRSRRDMG